MTKTDEVSQAFSEPKPKREPHSRQSKDPDRRLRMAAREHFRMAPSYCIRPELAGDYTLRRKRYEFLGDSNPGAATHWDILSHHPDFEEAERKLRLITSAPVFYDDRGRLS